ncbi:MAG: NAD(P)/FAD-dependent oxidoreductase [Nocardioides sp.]
MSDIVIIGGGLTAAKTIETLRADGVNDPITLIGDELQGPYERPQLSKQMLNGEDFGALHDQSWYADNSVRLLLGIPAVSIDRDLRTVTLADDSWVGYDQLLIATGASARVLDLPGAERALTLRSVADAEALRATFAAGKRLVIIGGGWIGLEVAAAARGAEMEVDVLEAGALPLGSVLGERLARHLVALHAAHGVRVHTEVTVEGIDNEFVRTSAGSLAADVVLVAVGAVPNTAIAEAAGLEVAPPSSGGGIVVNHHLLTADPAVLAAGDAAYAEHMSLGGLRVEHWDNAMRQGELAARSLQKKPDSYDWAPYFYTDQFEFSMEYVGHSSPDDTVEVRGDLAGNEFIAYWLNTDGVLTAAMNVGIWDVNDQLRAMIGSSPDPGSLTVLTAD